MAAQEKANEKSKSTFALIVSMCQDAQVAFSLSASNRQGQLQ